ncbi:MAG: hypothetical protein ACREID_09070, partial [Planctomycetota bacterium]
VAARRAVREEARRSVEGAHGRLRRQESELLATRNMVTVEIAEITKTVSEVERGTGSVPEGHTIAELQDKLGDLRGALRKLEADHTGLRSAMAEKEKLLAQEAVEPPEETLLTRELASLEALLKRAEALRPR